MLPIMAPGIAATALICMIFSWNEFFFAVNLTASQAATVPVFLTGFITSEGLFVAQLSAAAVMASLPIVVVGWIAQRQLVRGLSLGPGQGPPGAPSPPARPPTAHLPPHPSGNRRPARSPRAGRRRGGTPPAARPASRRPFRVGPVEPQAPPAAGRGRRLRGVTESNGHRLR